MSEYGDDDFEQEEEQVNHTTQVHSNVKPGTLAHYVLP
jgi:hypothetical protein